ncbi:MAG: glucosamine-6-phosphate synthase [Acidimicrobiaceae bacterium]|nr:glucosamine-6-phosphate synthase [Acidimicrobiaceae bacterium]
MCGIIAVLRRPSSREAPDLVELLGLVESVSNSSSLEDLNMLREHVESLDFVNSQLKGLPGFLALFNNENLLPAIETSLDQLFDFFQNSENQLSIASDDVEVANGLSSRLRDLVWSIKNDRIGSYKRVNNLTSKKFTPSHQGFSALLSLQQALSGLDRLEVRGRDSAGLQILVWDHDLGDVEIPEQRLNDSLFRSGSIRKSSNGSLLFVYKTASEIGDLGDNTNALRELIISDDLLAKALSAKSVKANVVGHTRWASVGLISESNAHPVESIDTDEGVVTIVQNGDVDNFADLIASFELGIPNGITTDARVVPELWQKNKINGMNTEESFIEAVRNFEGSVAIAGVDVSEPENIFLSVKGSGQSLYVGLAEDAYLVASEPYGLVEMTNQYLRIDGEELINESNEKGQVIRLEMNSAGTLEGIIRKTFASDEVKVREEDLSQTEISTRDIDRGSYKHYLLKEIEESPLSVRSTLRGRLVKGENEEFDVRIGTETLPDQLKLDLKSGKIRKIFVIGQGTAAVAGKAAATAISSQLNKTEINVKAKPATELSAFDLTPDMSNTLVVAISQSGTTTDTNRTVELVRARGAKVIAIVNRRNSDLTDRADGVLYTSDGRDIEMSVASTKAFYSQVVAGYLLAFAIAEVVSENKNSGREEILEALDSLPEAMEELLGLRGHISKLANQFAPPNRHWAIVGSGGNVIAAEEIRIKLSELCYKSIASDVIEDKKHIDLSSEPMILVCANGITGSTIDDIAKEVAIFRAHKAAPIVITDSKPNKFPDALDVISVPSTHPYLAFILATMAGHLFGYEAACSIDSQAQPLRVAHAAIEKLTNDRLTSQSLLSNDEILNHLREDIRKVSNFFFDELRNGRLNGHLEASTSVRLASLLRYSLGEIPLDLYQIEFGRVGTPSLVIDELAKALVLAIEELTRPVDAIKHQAKTVTVGISRSDENLLNVPLVERVLEAGTSRDCISYETLKLLVSLDTAIDEVTGYTRYRISGSDTDNPTLTIVDRDGVSVGIQSRVERDLELKGTKHMVAASKKVLLTKGLRDERTILLIPEVKDGETTGINLLHISLHKHLSIEDIRTVLTGYHNRYDAIQDAVRETEPSFRDDFLSEQSVEELLIDSVDLVAERLRRFN